VRVHSFIKSPTLHSLPSIEDPFRAQSPNDAKMRITGCSSMPSIASRHNSRVLEGSIVSRSCGVDTSTMDPFSEWRTLYQDFGRMNYLQLTVRSHEGQTKVQKQLNITSRKWKSEDIAGKTDDELYDFRMNFSESGLASHKKLEKGRAKWRASWSQSESSKRRDSEVKSMLANVSDDLSLGPKPSVQDLRRVYQNAMSMPSSSKNRR